MPRFEPFRALRYAASTDLDVVSAPPYDVLSVDDVERLRHRHPHQITHVDVPLEREGPRRYADAGRRLASWIADGVLLRDEEPSFTLYRMHFTDSTGVARRTVGVVGALEVVDEGADGVLPHERTTPKATTDRLDLTRATTTNLSPVWGLSLRAGLTSLLEAPADVVGACTDADGVLHQVERVTDGARVAAISAAVSSAPVLIADGHHRYAIARTFRDEVRRRGHEHSPAELTLTYVAELVEEQLSIDAIHRLYRGQSTAGLTSILVEHFDLSPAGPVTAATTARMRSRGALCLVDRDGTGTWLAPRHGAFEGVRDLDGALLEHALAGVDVEVTYQHGVEHVLAALRGGEVDAAVLIRPTSLAEIRRTADERLLMPPKSTFFTPKLRTGLVMRPLDGVATDDSGA